MAEFKGTVSKSIQKYIVNQQRRLLTTLFVISSLVLSPCFFVFPAIIGSERWVENGICATFGIISLVILWFRLIPLPSKTKEKWCFNHIFFDGEYIVGIYPDGREQFSLISDAKYVKDHGEYYEVFYARAVIFCCQKDLLVSGTLEEFEALFEGKIVRVNEEEQEK